MALARCLDCGMAFEEFSLDRLVSAMNDHRRVGCGTHGFEQPPMD